MKSIFVYADWKGLPNTMLMGMLHSNRIRGKEVFSFEYDSDWLTSKFAKEIDPDLSLFSGPQYLEDDKVNFGIFSDSSPDRWGRTLMKRREAVLALKEKRTPNQLFESDFLLGVDDENRMGALRFKLSSEGSFLANDPAMKAPPFTSIRELEQASLKLESNEEILHQEALKWLNMLMTPGSSLGGARPKANVKDPKGHLWIAKFPSKNDTFNSGAWEFILSQMAAELGIQVPQTACRVFSQKEHTFLSKRFDRNPDGTRAHFASAMTMLGYKDGHNHQGGGSYLELVEFIEQFGAKPTSDIRELWKRIVFSIMVSNTDDHLRNHGFLLTPKGWVLSPAYDINPNPNGYGLSLNISDDDNSLNPELALEVSSLFRWKESEAQQFLDSAKSTVHNWRRHANSLSISHREQTMLASAFSLVQ